MPVNLDRKVVLEKIEGKLKAVLEEDGLPLAEHNEATNLKTLGLEYLDAAEFLLDIEDEFGIRFGEDLIEPVITRLKSEDPETYEKEGYDHYLTIREITDYIVQKRQAA